ncbi:MAG: glycosyltransferase family 2 protein [Verrucomicrobiia bacterium]
MKPTLSVIIPALNEEENIAAAVAEVLRIVENRFANYELLLFDDGSRDRTGAIMDQLAGANTHLRVTHNPRPCNLGGVYKQGIAMARFDYVTWVPGDNENPGRAIEPPVDAIGKADIVLPYPTNLNVRPWTRRVISCAYTFLMNLLFGQRLRYFNGTAIFRTADLRSIIITTNSFAFQTEALLKLLKAGRSYVEVGIEIQPRCGRRSKALHLRNLIAVPKAVARLVAEIHFNRNRPKEIGQR